MLLAKDLKTCHSEAPLGGRLSRAKGTCLPASGFASPGQRLGTPGVLDNGMCPRPPLPAASLPARLLCLGSSLFPEQRRWGHRNLPLLSAPAPTSVVSAKLLEGHGALHSRLAPCQPDGAGWLRVYALFQAGIDFLFCLRERKQNKTQKAALGVRDAY